VVVQVALALVLLISSGLMVRTFQALKHVQPGFTAPEEILTFHVNIPEAQVPEPDRAARMYGEMVQRIVAVPGVQSVGLSNSMTMEGENDNDPIFAEDRPDSGARIPPLRRFKFISPGLFKTMGNPLLAGRDMTWTDIYEKRPVVLVSENFAREYWGGPARAIGKRIHETPNAPWREIIGVAGNERDDGVDQKPPTIVYWPMMIKKFWGEPVIVQRSESFAIRSARTGSSSFLAEIRRAVWSVNANVPIADVRTLKEIYDKSMARTSFTLLMLAIAAGMALLLGIVGIYGVISYSVSQRTREIGIRMALGAQRTSVMRMFVRHGLLLTSIGVVCGIAAAIAVTRLMSALLFQISPVDPITYVAVPIVLVASALLACYVPARRATVVDPVDALRVE
jgi:predicted permease